MKLEQIQQDNPKFWYPILVGYLETKIRHYFHENYFYEINMPVLNKRAVDKPINFKFSCFGYPLELTSSNALYLSKASAIYKRVFCCSTVFRKEEVNDKLHLLEFKIIEAEWKEHSYINLIKRIKEIFLYGIQVYNSFIREHALSDILPLYDKKIIIDMIPYNEIPKLLITAGKNLIPEENNVMYDYKISSIITNPCIVMFYPPQASWRAKLKNENESYTFNLILPDNYGELFEFSVRETNPKIIEHKLIRAEVLKQYEWYLNGLKWDSSPTVGFGMGVERFVNWLTQHGNIRDMQLFPRDIHYYRRPK